MEIQGRSARPAMLSSRQVDDFAPWAVPLNMVPNPGGEALGHDHQYCNQKNGHDDNPQVISKGIEAEKFYHRVQDKGADDGPVNRGHTTDDCP